MSNQHKDANSKASPPSNPPQTKTSQPRLAGTPKPLVWVALLSAFLLALFGSQPARADLSPPGCTGSGLGILLFTDTPDVHVGDTLKYSITVFNGTGLGPVVCDATEIVASVVTPDGVTHPITLVRTSLVNGQADFYKDVVSYVVRAQDIRSDGTLRATASDTGVIHQNDTNSQGGGFQGVNTEVSQPCIEIAVQCVGNVGENGAISFTGTVKNCGNNTLVGITVTNFVNGGQFPVAFITNLTVGQTAPFSGSYVPVNPCEPSTARLEARGTDQFTRNPRTVIATASTTCSEVLTAGIKVTKDCPTGTVSPGQPLVYSGTVTNTGNVTLVNVVVSSDQAPNTTVFTVASLAPGAGASFTGSYLAPTNCSSTSTLTARAASLCGVPVTSSASSTCPILTSPNISITAICPTGSVAPGGTVTYSGTVRNTGDIPLKDVVVLSDRPGANTRIFSVGTLGVGASANFSGSYTVPANACSVTTGLKATGQDICTSAATTATTSITCDVVTNPRITVTLDCPPTPATNGALITYTGTVSNRGDVTLNNVTVVNLQASPSAVFTVATLAPGASANFTARFVAPANTCSVSSTVTATGNDACSTALVSASASTTCPLITTPRIVITQNCPVNPVSPGSLLTFTGTIRNAGDVTLTNVVVLNDRNGSTPIFTAETLVPGASAAFSGSFTAAADVCTVTSSSTVRATSICGVTVTDSVSSTCPVLTAPSVSITAICPTGTVAPGGIVTYSGTVKNTGDIALNDVIVVSDRPAANTRIFSVGRLAVGASANFSGSYTVPADACSITTGLKVTGQDICTSATTTAATSITCGVVTNPRITVTLECPPTPATNGSLITYTGTVSNRGDITLNNVTVVNLQANPSTVFTVATLAPGASAAFTSRFTTPANACSVSSTVTATGNDACTTALVSASVSATCPLITTPRIVITQNCPVSPVNPGGLLTFTGTIRNAGDVTLTNVVVLNDRNGSTPIFTAESLAPGASAGFTGSFTAAADACTVTSSSTVRGTSICGTTVTDSTSSTCPVLTSPQILVTIVCATNPVAPGGQLFYSGTVRNAGNITLSNVVVISDRPSANTRVFTAARLAPGATANFSGNFNVGPDACSVTTTVNASGGDVCVGTIVTDVASATCPITTNPRIAVTLAGPTVPVGIGGVITFTGRVSNQGNVTLNNVTVVDSQSSPSIVLSIPTLAAGASSNFSASFTTPLEACNVTTTVTATGFDACTGTVVNDILSASSPLTTAPGLVLTQDCPVNPVLPGATATYTARIRNSGNITLSNLVVSSTQSALSPGETDPTRVGLVGYWSLNETSGGIANDGSGLANNGTILNAARVSGHSGNALEFNGVNTSVTVANTDSLKITGQITMSGWVKPRSVQGKQNILAHGYTTQPDEKASVYLRINDGRYEVGTWNGIVQPTASAAIPGGDIGTFVHLTGVYDGSKWTIYRNGVALDSVNGIGAVSVSSNWTIGARDGGADRFFDGVIDEVRLYNRALTGAEISTLAELVVTNPGSTTQVFTTPTLAPGAVADFTVTYPISANGACTFSSTLIATGNDVCSGVRVTDTKTSTCPVVTAPGIEVTQNCPATPGAPGSVLTYTGTVRNTGNITLTDVVVVNDRTGSTPVLRVASLAPGASANFSGSYVTLLNCCVDSSTVTATGKDFCAGTLVTDKATKTCPMLTSPKIVVTKVCPPKFDQPGTLQWNVPGELMTYSGTVSNAGNITLINVTVVNTQPSENSPVLGPITLAPGESFNYTASYIVPIDFCGTDTVTAQGFDVCSRAKVVDSVTSTCPVMTTPKISITKNCPSSPTPRGGVYTSTGTVRNSGNVTLVNVYVVDNQPTNNTPVLGPITLAPGASENFTRSYTAPADCCEIIDTVTARGQDRCTGSSVSATASTVCPLLTTPSILITRVCPTPPLAVGAVYTSTGTVKNTGDVTLTNVYVFSDKPGANTLLLGPIELAPGESEKFTSSYTTTAASGPAPDIITARGTDTCQARTVTTRADCFGTIGLTAPTITSVTAANGVVTIAWTTTPGVAYRLQRRSNSDDGWVSLEGSVTGTGTTAIKEDAIGSNRQCFYRILIVQE